MAISKYLVAAGEFCLRYKCATRMVGSQPDGDSVRFRPDVPTRFDPLPRVGRKPEFNTAGTVQLRLEAIDALETHFDFAVHAHQRWDLGLGARDFTLKALGFGPVTYCGSNDLTVGETAPDPVPGYVIAGGIDSNGRPVAFAFSGKPPQKSGTWLDPDVSWLKSSVNCKLAAAGLAYPAYYSTVPYKLRVHFDGLFKKAQQSAKPAGLWQSGVDKTASGVPAANATALQDLAVWPKLFRRLITYSKSGGTPDGFKKWLETTDKGKPVDDEAWVIGTDEKVWLRDIFEVRNGKVAMTVEPRRLIIEPK